MKHKKIEAKRHKLIKERKNVSGEPVELIAKRYLIGYIGQSVEACIL